MHALLKLPTCSEHISCGVIRAGVVSTGTNLWADQSMHSNQTSSGGACTKSPSLTSWDKEVVLEAMLEK